MRRDDTGVTDVFYMNFAEAQLPPPQKTWVKIDLYVVKKRLCLTDNVNLAKLFSFPDSKLF